MNNSPNILWIDIDSLRPDHLGCYGYHRPTSPNIDRIAKDGLRFDNLYVTDSPCLPSRAALTTCQHGRRSGIMAQGGRCADLPSDGPNRGGQPRLARSSWIWPLRHAGYHTASISSFPWRHGAWWWTTNFLEVIDSDGGGIDRADRVGALAINWLSRQDGPRDLAPPEGTAVAASAGQARRPWFLHVNFWDPHTPYNAPTEFGEPFADHPLPSWFSDELRCEQYEQGVGMTGARDMRQTLGDPAASGWLRQPNRMADMADARQMFDGYDTGIRYADHWVGRILDQLEASGDLADTAIVITSDHGESMGELNVYMDHQTADHVVNRVPMIVRWPGKTDSLAGSADRALRYQFDMAATMAEWIGADRPEHWDARSFADNLGDAAVGRDGLILSHGAWSLQRAARWLEDGREMIVIKTFDDTFHGYPPVMLFDVGIDPHQLHNLADDEPDLARRGLERIDSWEREMDTLAGPDPMSVVLEEGGPVYSRGHAESYLQRLRDTGRADRIPSLLERTRTYKPSASR